MLQVYNLNIQFYIIVVLMMKRTYTNMLIYLI